MLGKTEKKDQPQKTASPKHEEKAVPPAATPPSPPGEPSHPKTETQERESEPIYAYGMKIETDTDETTRPMLAETLPPATKAAVPRGAPRIYDYVFVHGPNGEQLPGIVRAVVEPIVAGGPPLCQVQACSAYGLEQFANLPTKKTEGEDWWCTLEARFEAAKLEEEKE